MENHILVTKLIFFSVFELNSELFLINLSLKLKFWNKAWRERGDNYWEKKKKNVMYIFGSLSTLRLFMLEFIDIMTIQA